MPTSTSAGLTGTVYAPPANAVVIAAGANIQSVVNAHPAGTAFRLSAGTYSGQTISPLSGDSFYGTNGQTVLNGNGAQQAFRGQGVSNVTISGLTITNYAPSANGIGTLGTDASSVNWVVQACQFTGISVGVPIMIGTGMIVKDCTIDKNQNSGIAGYNATGAVIENNTIYSNNQSLQSPFTATGNNAGIKLFTSTNTQILSNDIHGNSSAPGIWTDGGSVGTVINGNSITGNGVTGIIDELDYGATISNNTISGNNNPAFSGFQGGGIYIQNSANANVHGNTLSGNDGGVWVYESNRGSGREGAYVVSNDSVHDNTIQMASGQNGFGGSVRAGAVNWTANRYYLSGSSQLVASGAAQSAAQWQADGFDTAAGGATFSSASSIPAATSATISATPASSPSPSFIAPGQITTVGSGSNVLALQVSEDAYQGNAQFTVSVDGTQIGGAQTVTALHSAGQSQTFDVLGNFAVGTHVAAVDFLNDAYSGSSTTDRNLYVTGATINQTAVAGAVLTEYSQGPQSFSFIEH